MAASVTEMMLIGNAAADAIQELMNAFYAPVHLSLTEHNELRTLFIPFYREGNRGMKRLNNLSGLRR